MEAKYFNIIRNLIQKVKNFQCHYFQMPIDSIDVKQYNIICLDKIKVNNV